MPNLQIIVVDHRRLAIGSNRQILYKELQMDIKFTPGTKYSYSREAYIYLSKVIAHINQLTLSNLDSLFQKEVAEPLHLKHAHFGINKYVANHLASAHDGDKIVYDNSWDRRFFIQQVDCTLNL